MSIYEGIFDAEEIAAGIAKWAAIESPSFDAVAVNRMMDTAKEKVSALGADIERIPGTDGYGDVLRAHFNWGEGPGILVLGHLDTVHLVGTLAEKLMTFALGRGVEANDAPAIRQIVAEARAADFRLSSIVLGITKSVPFRMKPSVRQP